MQEDLPKRRYKQTISKAKEVESKCRQSRSTSSELLPESEIKAFTEEEKVKIEKFKSQMDKQVKKAIYSLRSRGYRVDDQNLYDRGLDFLIKTIRKVLERKQSDERISITLAFLAKTLVRVVARQAQQSGREVQGCQELLEATLAPSEEGVEEVIEEYGGMPKHMKDMLMKVIHKRPGERLNDIMEYKEFRKWWVKVRGQLQQWAKDRGLVD
jgi:hypothetical protein